MCGIIGVYTSSSAAAQMVLSGLHALQHRGQESWGITIPGCKPYKKLGKVSEFPGEEILSMKSHIGIGHTRYSTVSKTLLKNAHPIRINPYSSGILDKSLDRDCVFSIAHNGTIENSEEILERLVRDGLKCCGNNSTDTEIIGYRIAQELVRSRGDWKQTFKNVSGELNGSYSLLIVTDSGKLVSVRDGRGFRPLSYAQNADGSLKIIASEDCAIDYIAKELDQEMKVRDVAPGEIIEIAPDGSERSGIFCKSKNTSLCVFEHTYFAHPSSRMDRRNIYDTRMELGKSLFKKYASSVDGDVVIPVPDTARPAAQGFSDVSGIKIREGLIKDRYLKKGNLRSFIQPNKRKDITKRITGIKSVIDGKKVILVDDSIVRGNTTEEILKTVQRYGAKKIQLFITFPPVVHPCYMGIDFPTVEELLVNRIYSGEYDIGKINEAATAYFKSLVDVVDFVGFNDVDSYLGAVALSRQDACLGCTIGDYSGLNKRPRARTVRDEK